MKASTPCVQRACAMPSDGAVPRLSQPAHFLNRWTAQRKADAVAQNLAGPFLRRSAFTKKIPTVSLHKSLFNPNVRSGNIPALFADLAEEYGPVFKIQPPLSRPMIFLAGTETNYSVHQHGRMYLRARTIFLTSRKSTAHLEFYFPWTAPITSGFARPCRQRILGADWKGSWVFSTIMPGNIWRVGRLEIPSLRRA